LGSKVLPYEESVRCPLIISDPRHKKSGKKRKTEVLSANVDIPATILDLAGVEIPSVYDGKSLLPVLDKPHKSVRTSLPIIQVWGTQATHCFSIINQDYKYIYWFYQDEDQGLKPTEELFDLKNDPYEMVNLASEAKNKSQLNKMRELYDQQLQHWKSEGVKYNGYEKYGLLFDRNISWEEKQKVMIKGKRKG
jgi:arylsulfatase A-like enzyme